MGAKNYEILFVLSKGIATFKIELQIDKNKVIYDNFDIENINEVITYYNSCLVKLRQEDRSKINYRNLKKHRLIKLR